MKTSYLLIFVLLAGCATPPKKISAQYVSPLQYKDYDCEQIVLEQTRIERRTNDLYHSLKKDANGDKWQMAAGLVLFWPVLFALEGGDGPEASEYARLKGEYEALHQNNIQRKCQIKFQDDLKEVIADYNNENPKISKDRAAANVSNNISQTAANVGGSVVKTGSSHNDLFADTQVLAKLGDAKAQYDLGEMYFEGNVIAPNFVKSYTWFSIAAARGNKDGLSQMRKVSEFMSFEQIAKAQELSAACYKNNYEGCD